MPGYEEAEALSLILAGMKDLGKGIYGESSCLPSVILNSGFQRAWLKRPTMMELVQRSNCLGICRMDVCTGKGMRAG